MHYSSLLLAGGEMVVVSLLSVIVESDIALSCCLRPICIREGLYRMFSWLPLVSHLDV